MFSTALRAPEGTEAGAVVDVPAAPPPADTPAETPAAADPAPAQTPEAPAASEAPAAGEPAAEAAKPEEAAKPSLLSQPPEAEKKPDAKPADAPAAEAAPAVDKPVYQPFTMPEGLKANDELLSKFTDLIGSHKLTQEQGQALMDMHGAAIKAFADHHEAESRRVWADTQNKWLDEIKSDKEFGGAKFDTSTKAAMRMIDLLVPKAERAEFNKFLDYTGAGNNPWMFKMLNRVAQWLDEPVMPRPAAKPAKGNGKAPGAPRGLRSMYKDAAN